MTPRAAADVPPLARPDAPAGPETASPRRPGRALRAAVVVTALLAIAVHLNALGNGFAYDDILIIQENTSIHSLADLPEALWAPYWPNEHGKGLGLWRPLVTGMFGVEWAVWGDSPLPFHVANVLLHAVATGVVVVVLAELLPLAAAFAGGLVFAVHPVHVEAVANVVGRAEILSAIFYLLACLVFLRAPGRLGVGRSGAITGLFALAFLTKESAVTLPGALFLLDGARGNETLRDLPRHLRERGALYAALVVTAAVILAGRYAVLGSVAHPFAPLGADVLAEVPRIWTVASTWPHYFRLLFFPAELSVDYSPAVIPVEYGWNVVNAVGAGAVLGALGVAWITWRTEPMAPPRLSPRALGFGALWFLITISPISNFFFLSGVLLAERTLYLPSVGFVAFAGWGIVELARRRKALAIGVLAGAVGLMGYRTWERNPTWKDNITVFDTLLREHPESGRAQWALGDVLLQRDQLRPALRAYRVSIGILGGHYTLLTEIGRKLIGRELYQPAELLLRYAWEDRPEFATAPTLLAIVYSRLGAFEEAEGAARAAVALKDDNLITHHILARSLALQGRPGEAIAPRRDALRYAEEGRWQHWLWLAELQAATGDTVAALTSLDSARAEAADPAEIDTIDVLAAALGAGKAGP